MCEISNYIMAKRFSAAWEYFARFVFSNCLTPGLPLIKTQNPHIMLILCCVTRQEPCRMCVLYGQCVPWASSTQSTGTQHIYACACGNVTQRQQRNRDRPRVREREGESESTRAFSPSKKPVGLERVTTFIYVCVFVCVLRVRSQLQHNNHHLFGRSRAYEKNKQHNTKKHSPIFCAILGALTAQKPFISSAPILSHYEFRN